MADAVFRVAADVTDYVKKMDQADRSTKRVGKSAATIGDQVAKSIVKIELLNRALQAAGRAVSGVIDKATQTSQTAGERGISLATNLEGLKIKDILGVSKKVTAGGGLASADESAAFVKALAKTGAQGGDAQKLIEAFSKYGSMAGGEGGEKFIEGASKGMPAGSIIQEGLRRFSTISSAALGDPNSPLAQGIRGKLSEMKAQAAEEEAFLVSGTSQRAEVANVRAAAAQTPGGPVSVVNSLLGETVATMLTRGGAALNGYENAASRATDTTNALLVEANRNARKAVTAPSFATETR